MDNAIYTGKANLRPEDCYKYWGIDEPSEYEKFFIERIVNTWNAQGEELIKRVYEMEHRGEIVYRFDHRRIIEAVFCMFRRIIEKQNKNDARYIYGSYGRYQKKYLGIVEPIIRDLYPSDRVLAVVVYSPPIQIFSVPIVYTQEQMAAVAAIINPIYIPQEPPVYVSPVVDSETEHLVEEATASKPIAEVEEVISADTVSKEIAEPANRCIEAAPINGGIEAAQKSSNPPKRKTFDDPTNTIKCIMETHHLSSTELARKIGGEVTDAHIRAVTLGREFPKCRVIVMVCGLFGRNLAQWREDCPALEKAITKNMRGRTESFDEYVERLCREHGFTVTTV